MSGALLDAPTLPLGLNRPAGRERPARGGRPADGCRPAGGGRPTLEDLLAGTLHAARAHAEADCPLCEAPMHFADGAAHCDGCGSTLS
jgi:hypothetical protein